MNKLLVLIISCVTIFKLNTNLAYAQSLPYNFEDTYSIPIELSIQNRISTKDGILDGQCLDFKVNKNVFHNGKLVVKQGTPVKARVENVVTRGMNGFPAELYIDNFQIDGIKDSQLMDTYVKKGANLSLLVYPLKWALTPIPFVGSLTNLILGGNAIIKPKHKITIYYYPNWK